MFDAITEKDVLTVYEQLKNRYDLVLTTTGTLEGYSMDCPIVVGEANGLIVMGNEGKGVSPAVSALINRRLYVPNFPPERETTESLNVAIATAVVCAEFRRRTINVG